ncbi:MULTISPECIES: hypothetical protein [unclassified Paenarthrobacter]|uniref:hypothetical protein n=1 Tax=unclassified Paenarthrobacter TaxID=2634190 RepID=UPI001422951C|nr:hypothetical protein [Paenarthrobacter sp. MSM-2-10-13]NHW49320.1 hypothetical protein [Paenarthrobacter sp. MSM-2-10-13]
MAAQRTTAGSALLTGTLLAAVLAIITGILGMHVMTGTHSAHSAAAVPADAPVMATRVLATSGHPSGHASHQQSASSGAAALEELPASLGAASPAQCSCSGNCPSEHSMTAACIPSAAAGVLAAPVPAEAPSITAPSPASTFMAWSLWSYRPGGPSPGELSISRT